MRHETFLNACGFNASACFSQYQNTDTTAACDLDKGSALPSTNHKPLIEDKQINRCFSETTLDKFVTPVLLHSTVLQSSMWHGFHEYVMNCIELSSLSGREHGTR